MTWLDFVTAVRDDLPADNARINVATGTTNYVAKQIVHAVVGIQELIPFYRVGHETTYGPADLTISGLASVGSLPDQCRPLDAYYKKTGKQCVTQPLKPYGWGNRHDLVCGNPSVASGQFLITIDPQGKHFTVFPKVETGRQISLFWDGLKTTFSDADTVPFDDQVVEAVSLFVKAQIARMADHDLNEHNSYMLDFVRKRGMLLVGTNERTRMRLTASSPSTADNCANISSVCPTTEGEIAVEDTLEFCAFGDSGDTSINTSEVANLVKGLEPDFVMHMGDCNYPSGDPVTIQDLLVKFYGIYIPESFYLAFGNHDIATDGGVALDALLTTQAALNSGLRYYDFIPDADTDPDGGKAHIFVLDSNDPLGCLPGTPQGIWLAAALALSTDKWNIVVCHKAPYTSDVSHAPGETVMRADFKGMGAHVVLSGHAHNYERLLVGGFPYVVCGLGGAPKRNFVSPATTGSQFRYNTFYGSLWITATTERMQISFFNTAGDEVDSISFENAPGQMTP